MLFLVLLILSVYQLRLYNLIEPFLISFILQIFLNMFLPLFIIVVIDVEVIIVMNQHNLTIIMVHLFNYSLATN